MTAKPNKNSLYQPVNFIWSFENAYVENLKINLRHVRKITVSHIWISIFFSSMESSRDANSRTIVEGVSGVNFRLENCNVRHDLPTPFDVFSSQ